MVVFRRSYDETCLYDIEFCLPGQAVIPTEVVMGGAQKRQEVALGQNAVVLLLVDGKSVGGAVVFGIEHCDPINDVEDSIFQFI